MDILEHCTMYAIRGSAEVLIVLNSNLDRGFCTSLSDDNRIFGVTSSPGLTLQERNERSVSRGLFTPINESTLGELSPRARQKYEDRCRIAYRRVVNYVLNAQLAGV